jgi:hypothetical protein
LAQNSVPSLVIRIVLLALVALGMAGCRQNLLSPSECEYLAERLSGITAPHQLRNPRLRAEVAERTQHCLLTPYDRRFVRCLETQGRLDQCELDLQARLPRPR